MALVGIEQTIVRQLSQPNSTEANTICRADPEAYDQVVWGSGMGFISRLI